MCIDETEKNCITREVKVGELVGGKRKLNWKNSVEKHKIFKENE